MKIYKYTSKLLWIITLLVLSIASSCTHRPLDVTDQDSSNINNNEDQTSTISTEENLLSNTASQVLSFDDDGSWNEPAGFDITQNKPLSIEKKTDNSSIEYKSQSGDTLYAIASHFGVPPDQIKAKDSGTNLQGYIEPGTYLQLPKRLENYGPSELILPDSEVVYSMSAHDFDIQDFIHQAEGYLCDYKETIIDGSNKSHQIVRHVALNNSIDPRLLLTLLEYQSNWVYGSKDTIQPSVYPMNYIDPSRQGLNLQLNWTADQLNKGYYGWRDGTLTELQFPDGSRLRLAPSLNAGTVAVQFLLSTFYNQTEWYEALYGLNGIKSLYELYFGDPWERAKIFEPLIPSDLKQPELTLPFEIGHGWNLTGGPHPAWGPGSPWAAVDFAPTGISGCELSDEWITSAAPGLVVRTEKGLVMVDLDGDGYEQSGWNLLYMHVYEQESAKEGDFLYINDHVGHPSCSGGSSTGTHVHLARKYNGEWIPADSPAAFFLSGWQIYPGSEPYAGMLFKNGMTINASNCSDASSLIIR